jgi:uncharacterized membrane protein YesL
MLNNSKPITKKFLKAHQKNVNKDNFLWTINVWNVLLALIGMVIIAELKNPILNIIIWIKIKINQIIMFQVNVNKIMEINKIKYLPIKMIIKIQRLQPKIKIMITIAQI